MSLDLWLAFSAAAAALLLLPGPTVLLVVSYALAHGRRAALAVVAGVALGDFVAMTASLAGLGVLLGASALLFTALKWLGAAYLVWLGIRLWRAPVGDPGIAAPALAATSRRRMFGQAFLVTALNPKGILFFVAFLPQFLEAGRPLLQQFAVMEATFIGLAVLNALGYALLASGARRAIRRPAVQRAVNRVGGSLLVAAGVATAAWKRAAA
ncbi:MAG: LysE family translocator [Sneathiellaceae bacterium]